MNGKFKDEKNDVTVESNLLLLLKVVCVFEVLELTMHECRQKKKRKNL